MTRRIRRPGSAEDAQRNILGGTLRSVQVQQGLPDVEDLEAELEDYMDVLMGRVPPPVEAGELTLMEVADTYFARACEIQYHILKAEREGGVFKGHSYYKFRTGQLRSFLELSKKAAELGSRRLTQAQLEHDMSREALDLDWDPR